MHIQLLSVKRGVSALVGQSRGKLVHRKSLHRPLPFESRRQKENTTQGGVLFLELQDEITTFIFR